MKAFSSSGTTYVDSPSGIVTASGTRYRTTEGLLREFAAPVFERESLGDLIRQAEVWGASPVTITLWILPAMLLLMPSWAAIGTMFALFVTWTILTPAVPVQAGIAIVSVLQKPALQGVYYVTVLSILAWQSQTVAVIVGLVGFIALRFGLVDRLLRPFIAPLLVRMYPLPVPDQVLRAVIVRAALRHNVQLAALSELEKSAREAWNIRGKR